MRLSRRQFTALGLAATVATAVPVPAFALTGAQAQALVDRAVADINAIISSGGTEAQMVRQFKDVFDDYAHTAAIAASALGVAGRSASNAQRSAFVDAFGLYLANKYGRRFREFEGGEIIVQRTVPVNNYMEVQTIADLPGQAPFRVDFHVYDRPGRPVFFNLIVEGVNLLVSERQEIGAMLDQRGGNLDRLIADLRAMG
ncbi:ABC transporter substrate-binding protein [Salibaculum griseiflavum]|uniref:ABC transporter substrate-binding protein n=1 Tax=Salibaculum griseiflavum TaxID=1914409 RepID=UPI002E2687EC